MVSKHYQFAENNLLEGEQNKERPIYNFMDILKQHKARYYFTLSTGEQIKVKHLSKKDNDRILLLCDLLYPNHIEIHKKFNRNAEMLSEIPVGNDEDFKKWAELMEENVKVIFQLKPIIELMAIGVIEQPYIWDKDSAEAFFSGMNESDRELVYKIVADLCSPIPFKWISFDEYWFAMKFGIKVIDEEFLESMTVNQYNGFAEIFRQEMIDKEREMNKMQNAMGGAKW